MKNLIYSLALIGAGLLEACIPQHRNVSFDSKNCPNWGTGNAYLTAVSDDCSSTVLFGRNLGGLYCDNDGERCWSPSVDKTGSVENEAFARFKPLLKKACANLERSGEELGLCDRLH